MEQCPVEMPHKKAVGAVGNAQDSRHCVLVETCSNDMRSMGTCHMSLEQIYIYVHIYIYISPLELCPMKHAPYGTMPCGQCPVDRPPPPPTATVGTLGTVQDGRRGVFLQAYALWTSALLDNPSGTKFFWPNMLRTHSLLHCSLVFEEHTLGAGHAACRIASWFFGFGKCTFTYRRRGGLLERC